MKRAIVIICILIGLSSCSSLNWKELILYDLYGNSIELSAVQTPVVFYFLSPECPLCENYALNINTIFEDEANEKFTFYGVFPGEYYTKDQIRKYKIKYGLELRLLLDPDYKLTNALDAEVTPEVVVINVNDKIVYQGAIDNWMLSLGKKRSLISEKYLLDALEAVNQGKEPQIKRTKAVGCYIE